MLLDLLEKKILILIIVSRTFLWDSAEGHCFIPGKCVLDTVQSTTE